MLRNLPFSGDHPAIQSFGDNPDFYRSFSIDGIQQRGHNGIDFDLPAGTPVLSVQSGSVLETGEDEGGYGAYVVIGHLWGQTLYGHLSRVSVSQGEEVSAGQSIALSGSSGAATNPHLHFGLRIYPFSQRDGWFGFSDPKPYLTRISQGRGPVMGPHVIGGIDLELMKRWQPRMVLVLDPNPDEMERLREVCPNTVIVGRVFATDHEISENIRESPADAARWAHSKTMDRMNPHVNYWQFANEILQHRDELHLLNEFELRRMELANGEGYKCAILAFSVGNPDLPEDDRMACWEKVYPAIEHAEQNDHAIAVHQYGMPDLLGPEGLTDWLILRLEHQILMRLPFKKVKFAVTEYGIDGLIQGPSPSGWKHFTNAEAYAEQLLRNGRYVERYSGRILGYAVFTLGHFSPWGSYDIMGPVARVLAEQSPRGTWADIGDLSEQLGTTEGDRISSPGAGAAEIEEDGTDGSVEQPDPSNGETAGGQDNGEQPEEQKLTSDSLPQIERRISENIPILNAKLHGILNRPDLNLKRLNKGDIIYLIKDVFTTANGSWELSDDQNSVVQWARDSYLKPFGAPDWFDDAGADHHIFGAVLGLDGQLMGDQEIIYWSDGFDSLANPEYAGYVRSRTKSGSGWANQPIGPGSSFVPERGEHGPWSWMPSGIAEVFEGGGLPARHHVSTFVVWQAVEITESIEVGSPGDDLENTPDTQTGQPDDGTEDTDSPEDGADQGEDTSDATDDETVISTDPQIERRLGHWIDDFNISVTPVNKRRDAESVLASDDVVYVLKDLFTTRDGSWELSDKPGSITEWAREYLKPFGAPDYFDDAGGDRHLFAAVIGLDGELMKNKEVIYWSDGIEKLGDESYDGFVYRQTKDKSGWINIPIGPGSNFVPERGESGPWCWAPSGAADVVCGGGLPAKQHVSTFAVWQAVPKQDLIEDETDSDDSKSQEGNGSTIYVPFMAGGGRGAESADVSSIVHSGEPAMQSSETTAEPDLASDAMAGAADLDTQTLNRMRMGAWSRAQVEYDHESTLAKYARQHGFGMPATDSFEIDGYMVQGFNGAIVYAPVKDADAVGHILW